MMIRIVIILLLSTCACFNSKAQVDVITTIAGTGVAGYSGDGGLATDAKLNRPYAIIADKYNNLVFCEAFNHVVRKLNLVTGMITTIAGTGIAGFSGDGGQANDARLEVPQGICIDTSGNIYISDGFNQRIRKIDRTTGIITTIAGSGSIGNSGDGGAAILADFNGPIGLHCGYEYLYISDYSNNRVRRINLTTGIITQVAGNIISGYSGDGGLATNAKLNGVIDVVVDQAGDLYIADAWNGAIRKVKITSGIITTYAGNGVLGYSGDGGHATNAQLNEPGGLFIDKLNNLYISDYRNGAIRKVDGVTGIITTVAGGSAGYAGDGGPATNAKLKCAGVWVDDNGNIYIADYVNDRIRRVSSGVAVSGIDKEIESRLYPNPCKGTFTIQTPINIVLVSIYNIAGMRVYERTCTATETEIDITNQPPGVYMVYVQCGEKRYVSKVVKE